MSPRTPTQNPTKLQLKRKKVPWMRLSILVGGGILILLLGVVGYLRADDDGDPREVNNPVGSDLTLSSTFKTTLKKSTSSTGSSDAFPSMTRYQMSSVTPRRSRRIIRNDSSKTLQYVNHTVKKGESIWKIARQYGLRTHSVASVNADRLRNRDYLPVGMELRIPNRNGILTSLKPNQTVWDLVQTYRTDLETILTFNEIKSPSKIATSEDIFVPGATPVNPYKYQLFQPSNHKFSWPVSPGRRTVSSGYGRRDHPVLNRVIMHRGIDIAAKYSSAIFASRAGIVEYANRKKGYGYMVKIRHGDNFRTVYSHLSKGFVQEGQYVQKGQRIGLIGQSGLATGPNLHFEIRRKNRALDPLKYLANR